MLIGRGGKRHLFDTFWALLGAPDTASASVKVPEDGSTISQVCQVMSENKSAHCVVAVKVQSGCQNLLESQSPRPLLAFG